MKKIGTMKRKTDRNKNNRADIKDILEGMKCRMDKAEDLICDLEDKVDKKHPIGATTTTTTKRSKKNENILMETQDKMKHNSICKIRLPKEEGEQGIEHVLKKVNM